MSDREVTVKMSVKNPDGARPLKELSDITKALAGDEKAYQKLLKDRIDSYKLATRLKEDMAKAGIGLEMTEEQKYQKLLKERINAYQTAKRLKTDLAKAGIGGGRGMAALESAAPFAGVVGLTLPTTALAAFAATIKIADSAVKSYYGSIERGQFSSLSFKRKLQQSYENNVPIFGEIARHMPWESGQESTEVREFRAFLAQQGVGVSGQRARLFGERDTGVGGLLMQDVGRRADLLNALQLRRAQYGIAGGAMGLREQALASITGGMGYGRAEQTADVFQQIAFREQLAGIGASGAARVGGIGERLSQAELQEAYYRQNYQQKLQAERMQKEILDRHIKAGGTVGEEANILRADMSARAAERREAEEHLMQAQKQSLELRQQKEQAILQTQEQQHAAQRQQLQTLSQMAQAEKQRQQGLRESLGLQHPMTLRTSLGISRKIKAGMNLTQGEIQFMQSHADVFGSQLQQIGAQRAASGPYAGMIQELMANTGQGQRLQALEAQKLQLQNEININVSIDESILQQIEDKIKPRLTAAIQQVEIALRNRLGELENARLAQQRAVHPQS